MAAVMSIVGCDSDDKNAAPIVFTNTVTAQFEQVSQFTVNATDAESDPLQYQVVKAPKTGLLENKGNGLFVYTPVDHQVESQQFTLEISDGVNTVSQTINITIVDERPFVVESTLPVDMAQQIPLNTSFTIKLNSAIATLPQVDNKCSSVLWLESADNNCIAAQVSLGDNNKTVILTPAVELAANSSYQLMLDEKLQNFVGNTLTTSQAFSYRTAHNELVISEVMLDPNRFKQRWLEIYNGTDKPVSLSQYTIRTEAIDEFGARTENYHFSLPDISLAVGEHLIVQNDTYYYSWQTGFVDGPGITIIADGDKRMFWDASGQVALVKAKQVVDAVYFGETDSSDSDWNGAAVATSYDSNYITRSRFATDTNSANDWQLTLFPTAGYYNDVECQDDADLDGIPDCSEQEGKTYAGLPLYKWGARPEQKDIFLEVDHMDSDDLGIVPQVEAIDKVVEAFNKAGFKLHLDAGNLFDTDNSTSKYNLGGGNQVPFVNTIHFSDSPARASIFQYKHKYFDLKRRNAFHYMLFANSQRDDGAAGSSGYAEINGNDALITLGGWGLSNQTDASKNYLINIQASTMMHELGHNFGFYHGGQDDVNNKPNHLSVMNYMYQLQGLPTIGNDEGDRMLWRVHPFNENCTSFDYVNGPDQDYRTFNINYSHGKSVALDESNLLESVGFGHQNSNPIDYNCSGSIDQEPVTLDYNQNDWLGDVFYDFDEWSGLNLRFNIDSASASFRVSTEQVELEEIAPSPALLEQIKQAKSN